MAVAFAFSSYAGANIFVANTPRVNRNYLADLQNKFKKGANNIYLAISFFNRKPVKKNIAVIYPTLVPAKNNMSGILGSPTAIPIATKVPQKSGFAKIDPATIPANLFKSISTGVSAYDKVEGEGEGVILKINKGTTYKVRKIEFNGKQYEIIDLTSQ